MALTRVTDKQINFSALVDAVDDAAAAIAGVSVGSLYRNGSVIMVRIA